VDRKIADESLTQLEIDSVGLDGNDHRYLNFIARHHQGGPVGIDTLAAALSEHKDAIEDTIEPYLMQIGMLMRTPRGRMITHATFEYLGIQKPKPPEQTSQDLDNSLQLRIFEQ
jgi:Holliday junction DNA helicase RuvB